ncbi:MAG: hypothetical protein MUO52_10150 [Desulfobacterales bacterium]|nr:hypothetical protein [Desulfobacterales bacterium]
MEEIIIRERHRNKRIVSEAEKAGQFQSVEFFIDGVECPHQFRIWKGEPASMFVLVKQNSEILGHLRVGDVMEMKYYTSDSFCPTRTMETEISHITREDEGRFQGHCLVGLAVPQG